MTLRSEPIRPLDYCLTCGGTGRRGNLSGKKLCPTCKGEKTRKVELTGDGEPLRNLTPLDDWTASWGKKP